MSETDLSSRLWDSADFYTQSQSMQEEEYNKICNYLSRKEYPKSIKRLQKSNWKKKCEKFVLKDNKLFFKHEKYKDLEVILESRKLKILEQYHHKDDLHLGCNRMREAINQKYYWKNITEDVKNFNSKCLSCQSVKSQKSKMTKLNYKERQLSEDVKHELNSIHSSINELFANPIEPLTDNRMLFLDIMGPLQESHNGHKFIAILTDRKTGYAEAELIKDLNTEEIGHFIFKFILRHGFAITIFASNSGIKNIEEFSLRLNSKLQNSINNSMKKQMLPSLQRYYNEYYNIELRNLIAKFIHEIDSDKYNWDLYKDHILLAYNTWSKKDQSSPYFKTYHTNPCLPFETEPTCIDIWEWAVRLFEELSGLCNPMSKNIYHRFLTDKISSS